MGQIQRIKNMEEKYIKSQKAIKELNKALKEYSKVQESIRELAAYYSGSDWKKDYQDDEKGKLPKDLKRGVLSEDGIYNLLDDNIEMQKRLCRTIEKSIS